MSAGERRSLINYLVHEITNKFVNNNKMQPNYASITICLIAYVQFEVDNLIKPPGAASKIVMPNSYVRNEETVERVAPSIVTTPEEVELGNIAKYMCEEEVENNNNSLISYEDDKI